MKFFSLALTMLRRDKRSGELTILVFALLIAVTSSTAISLFANRLERTMTEQTAEFLAADLVITSHAVIPEPWLEKAKQLHLQQSQTTEFASVLMEHEEMLLAGIKAVSSLYPLRGFLKTTTSDYSAEISEHSGPEQGFAWVEKRVLTALKVNIGDPIIVGEKKLVIAKTITYEPDKQGDIYSFSPRVMINQQDLQATAVIQPGSHVHYFFQFSGESAALSEFKQWVKPQLNLTQKVMDIHEDRPEIGSALNRAQRYLGLSSIVVIIISGVAIAMATRRYTERHLDATAILRCLGCKQRDVLWLFVSQFIVLGLLTSALGCLLGWFAQEILFDLLKELLPQHVAKPSLLAIFLGLISGVTVLLGFSLPPLLRLKEVSPIRVLRRELEPLPSSAWLVYGLSIIIVTSLIWLYTNDLIMTATIFCVGLALLLLLGFIIHLLLKLARRYLPTMGLNWRFGLQGLLRNSRATISQTLAFTITLTAMALSFTVRNDLIENWRKQLPEHAPNHFALNIFPDQLSALQKDFKDNAIEGSRFYPVVRGRLTEINNVPVQKVVSKDSQGENAIHRELSLTWTETLPEENKITAGSWWSPDQKDSVSVEEKLAENLKIKLGDQLLFVVGGQKLTVTVSSIRSLRWDTMKPNFYMIFPPGALDAFPKTFITSFYIPDNKKNILNSLVKNFPAMTVLDVGLMLKQFKTIVMQLTEAINYLLYFALMAGFTVLFAAIFSSLDSRLYEGAILRALGANRSLLRRAHLFEFSLMGLASGVVAVIVTEVLLYALYAKAMHLDYQPTWYLWWVMPLIGTVSVGIAGYWGLRQVANSPPIKVLRES